MNPIIRFLTAGKPIDLINQGIVAAIQSGSRVLVKAGSLTPNFPQLNSSDLNLPETDRSRKLDSENSAIASWAENLSQQHGLVWQCVGPDVLFTRTNPETLIRK